jgi:hypothetical protein
MISTEALVSFQPKNEDRGSPLVVQNRKQNYRNNESKQRRNYRQILLKVCFDHLLFLCMFFLLVLLQINKLFDTHI